MYDDQAPRNVDCTTQRVGSRAFLRRGIACCFVFAAATVGFTKSTQGETPQLLRFEFVEPHMGMPVDLVLYADNEIVAKAAARAAYDEIRAVDLACTDYDESSELMKLCASAPHDAPQPASPLLFDCLEAAWSVSEKSEGAFDVTVGPYVQQWKKSRRTKTLPTPETIRLLSESVGFRFMELDARTNGVRLVRPKMRITLGGIAAGYAVDRALERLRTLGVASALVNASGDIGASDPPPGLDGWRVEVQTSNSDQAPTRTLLLANGAVTASGDLTQKLQIGGVNYSHIIDPQTGLGMTNRAFATAAAPTCTIADALATTLCVAGGDRFHEILSRFEGAEAHLTVLKNGELENTQSPGFKRLLASQN